MSFHPSKEAPTIRVWRHATLITRNALDAPQVSASASVFRSEGPSLAELIASLRQTRRQAATRQSYDLLRHGRLIRALRLLRRVRPVMLPPCQS